MKIDLRVFLICNLLSLPASLQATTLRQRAELLKAGNEVILCLKQAKLTGPADVQVYFEEEAQGLPESIVLERYSPQCLRLDPKKLLGDRQVAVMKLHGRPANFGRGFLEHLAIRCNVDKTHCTMFLGKTIQWTKAKSGKADY